MNVYIPTGQKEFFLKKLKEIHIVDDYILDRSRFGKEKIKINSRFNTYEKIAGIVPYLPENSMMVSRTDYPGKEFILCVGEVPFSDFSKLQKEKIDITILTKKEKTVRFNAWVHLGSVESFYNSDYIFELSSINGKIEEQTFFVFETNGENFDEIYRKLSNHSDELIIKDKKIYVKLLLKEFTKIFNSLGYNYEAIDVVDSEEEFF